MNFLTGGDDEWMMNNPKFQDATDAICTPCLLDV